MRFLVNGLPAPVRVDHDFQNYCIQPFQNHSDKHQWKEQKMSDQFKVRLENIIQEKPNSIEASVAQEALAYDNIPNFFTDLLSHGCISGMISSLIYYCQTHAFFDLHSDQIDELRYDYEEETGSKIDLGYDMKNTLAWFSFEQVAYHLANEIGVQI